MEWATIFILLSGHWIQTTLLLGGFLSIGHGLKKSSTASVLYWLRTVSHLTHFFKGVSLDSLFFILTSTRSLHIKNTPLHLLMRTKDNTSDLNLMWNRKFMLRWRAIHSIISRQKAKYLCFHVFFIYLWHAYMKWFTYSHVYCISLPLFDLFPSIF